MAALQHHAPGLVVELGREGPCADPGRVGLGDPPDLADVARPDPGADTGRSGDRVGGGDEGIGAVVEVEQRSLGAFEDHGLAGVQRLPAEARGVGDVRLQPVPVGAVLLGHRVQVERRVLLVGAQRQPLRLQRRHDLLAQDLLVEQVLDPDPEPRCLVGVAGAYPAPGGADRELAQLRLAGGVEQHVVGHDQVRVGGDPQPADVDPPAPQLVELLPQHPRVEHDAVTDRADLVRVEDPRGDQVELERLAVTDDRVAGVVAALEPHDHLRPLGEQVGDLPLSFVAPLGADYYESWHGGGIMRIAGTPRRESFADAEIEYLVALSLRGG